MDYIICAECDLDICTLEKICNLSYYWIVVSDSDPFFWGGGVERCIIVWRW